MHVKRLRISHIGIHFMHNTRYCKIQIYVCTCIHVPLQEKTVDIIKDEFPFTKYFENAPQPIFKGRSYAEDMDMAEGCFRHIKKIFTQLEVRNIVCKLPSYYRKPELMNFVCYLEAICNKFLMFIHVYESQRENGKFLNTCMKIQGKDKCAYTCTCKYKI